MNSRISFPTFSSSVKKRALSGVSGRKMYAIGAIQIVGRPSTRKSRRHFASEGLPEVIPYANAPEKLVARGAADKKMPIRRPTFKINGKHFITKIAKVIIETKPPKH